SLLGLGFEFSAHCNNEGLQLCQCCTVNRHTLPWPEDFTDHRARVHVVTHITAQAIQMNDGERICDAGTSIRVQSRAEIATPYKCYRQQTIGDHDVNRWRWNQVCVLDLTISVTHR